MRSIKISLPHGLAIGNTIYVNIDGGRDMRVVDGNIIYLDRVKVGGARKSRKNMSLRVEQEPVLYPDAGIKSTWTTPRHTTAAISVDGVAPVNFLTENIE
jgi:hypothetical protein